MFLSFRGIDTRKNFVSHLYAALSNAGIDTFLDDEKLHKGGELGPELLRAIATSRISIVVFSQNYVRSLWCLKELVKILKCRTAGQVVLPVFYDVTPSSLRFGDVMLRTMKEENDDGYTWFEKMGIEIEQALDEAAGLVGWDVRNYR